MNAKPRYRAVDVHAHLLVPESNALVEPSRYFWAEPFFAYSSDESNRLNQEHFGEIGPKLTDPEERIRDMDRMGITLQALSVAPPQYYYWLDPSLGAEVARRHNDIIAGIVRQYPDRFVGLATVPLQDVERAVAELRHSVQELGFRGVEVSTNVNGVDLDNERFRPFFAALVELDVCAVIHPLGFTHAQRLREYYLTNIIGQPLESTIALSRLILSGIYEEFENLKLCVVHGGGYLPFYSSRLEHAYHHRAEVRGRLSAPPSEYLKRVYVDCLVYDAAHLRVLIEHQGLDRVVIGTDYPFDMGFYDPLAQIAGVETLSEADRQAIAETNAHRLLGLSD